MEEFDCLGKLSSLTLESVSVDPADPGREEQRLLAAKLFFDSSGLLIRRQEPGKTVFLHYSDDGLLEKEVEVLDKESISRETRYIYAAGRLLEEISGGERISYHYNNQDRLSYSTNWMGDIQESICSYGFDDEGRIILKEIRDNEGELLRRCRLKRDPMGLISEEITINQSNMVLEHCRYSYPVFHRANWLKREKWSLILGEEPVLTEILYRNIALASDFLSDDSEDREPLKAVPPSAGGDDITQAGKGAEKTESDRPPKAVQPEEQTEPGGLPSGERETDAASSKPHKELRFRNGQYRGLVDEEDRPHGIGEFWGRDGSRYSGGFSHGRMEGHGNLLHRNGSSYTGSFAGGLPQGEGECLWPDGSRYRGQFAGGEMHGIGSFTWADGSRFTGLFEHNRSTDQGLLESVEIPETIEMSETPGEEE